MMPNRLDIVGKFFVGQGLRANADGATQGFSFWSSGASRRHSFE